MTNAGFRKWLGTTIEGLRQPMLDEEPQDALDMSSRAVSVAASHAADLGLANLYAARPTGRLWPSDAIAYLSRCLAEVSPEADPAAPMTIEVTAERYGIPVRTLYKLCAAGLLKHSRVGTGRGRIRIRPADMDRYLNRAAAPDVVVKNYLFGSS